MAHDIFVSYDELRDHGIAFTRVHLNRLMDRGQFPRSVQISPARIAWRLSELESWKAALPAARRFQSGSARRVAAVPADAAE
jgi:prophage regulatory protein